MSNDISISLGISLDQKDLSSIRSQIESALKGLGSPLPQNVYFKKAAGEIDKIKGSTDAAADATEHFGRVLGRTGQRFSAYIIASSVIGTFSNSIAKATSNAIKFEYELAKIAQTVNEDSKFVKRYTTDILKISRSYGLINTKVSETIRVLAQAGLSFDQALQGAEALAKTTLLATFDNLDSTTEAFIATMRTFNLTIRETEAALEDINLISKKYAVESNDLVEAIKRTGGVFAATGGTIQELNALFTSVRATTRESADTIATGFRTIFSRLQRPKTIEFFKELNIELADARGNFIGNFEAIRKISEGLKAQNIQPGSIRFAEIVEEIGGLRQVSRVIPLLNQFGDAQEALRIQNEKSNETDVDVKKSKETLSFAIKDLQQNFSNLIAEISQDNQFQLFAKSLIGIANAAVEVARSIRPIIPLLAGLGALRLSQGILRIHQQFVGDSGAVRRYANGGPVSGIGDRDNVPALLTPGEFVVNKKSAQAYGYGRLHQINRYAKGGPVQRFASGGGVGGDDESFARLGSLIDIINKKLAESEKGRVAVDKKGGTKELIYAPDLLATGKKGLAQYSEETRKWVSENKKLVAEAKKLYKEFLVERKATDKDVQSLKEEIKTPKEQTQAEKVSKNELASRKNLLGGDGSGANEAIENLRKNIERDEAIIEQLANSTHKGDVRVRESLKKVVDQNKAELKEREESFIKGGGLTPKGTKGIRKGKKISTDINDTPYGSIAKQAVEEMRNRLEAAGVEISQEFEDLASGVLKAAANPKATRGEFKKPGSDLALLSAIKSELLGNAGPQPVSEDFKKFVQSELAKGTPASQIQDKFIASQTEQPKVESIVQKVVKAQSKDKSDKSKKPITIPVKVVESNEAIVAPSNKVPDITPPAAQTGGAIIKFQKKLNPLLVQAENGLKNIQSLFSQFGIFQNMNTEQFGPPVLPKLGPEPTPERKLYNDRMREIAEGAARAKRNEKIRRSQGTVIGPSKEPILLGDPGPIGPRDILDKFPQQVRSFLRSSNLGEALIEEMKRGFDSNIGTLPEDSTKRGALRIKGGGERSRIFLNPNLSEEQRASTLQHEISHQVDLGLGRQTQIASSLKDKSPIFSKTLASQTAGTFQFDIVERLKPIYEERYRLEGKTNKQIEYLASNAEIFVNIFQKATPEVRALLASTTDSAQGMQALAAMISKVGNIPELSNVGAITGANIRANNKGARSGSTNVIGALSRDIKSEKQNLQALQKELEKLQTIAGDPSNALAKSLGIVDVDGDIAGVQNAIRVSQESIALKEAKKGQLIQGAKTEKKLVTEAQTGNLKTGTQSAVESRATIRSTAELKAAGATSSGRTLESKEKQLVDISGTLIGAGVTATAVLSGVSAAYEETNPKLANFAATLSSLIAAATGVVTALTAMGVSINSETISKFLGGFKGQLPSFQGIAKTASNFIPSSRPNLSGIGAGIKSGLRGFGNLGFRGFGAGAATGAASFGAFSLIDAAGGTTIARDKAIKEGNVADAERLAGVAATNESFTQLATVVASIGPLFGPWGAAIGVLTALFIKLGGTVLGLNENVRDTLAGFGLVDSTELIKSEAAAAASLNRFNKSVENLGERIRTSIKDITSADPTRRKSTRDVANSSEVLTVLGNLASTTKEQTRVRNNLREKENTRLADGIVNSVFAYGRDVLANVGLANTQEQNVEETRKKLEESQGVQRAAGKETLAIIEPLLQQFASEFVAGGGTSIDELIKNIERTSPQLAQAMKDIGVDASKFLENAFSGANIKQVFGNFKESVERTTDTVVNYNKALSDFNLENINREFDINSLLSSGTNIGNIRNRSTNLASLFQGTQDSAFFANTNSEIVKLQNKENRTLEDDNTLTALQSNLKLETQTVQENITIRKALISSMKEELELEKARSRAISDSLTSFTTGDRSSQREIRKQFELIQRLESGATVEGLSRKDRARLGQVNGSLGLSTRDRIDQESRQFAVNRLGLTGPFGQTVSAVGATGFTPEAQAVAAGIGTQTNALIRDEGLLLSGQQSAAQAEQENFNRIVEQYNKLLKDNPLTQSLEILKDIPPLKVEFPTGFTVDLTGSAQLMEGMRDEILSTVRQEINIAIDGLQNGNR